MRFLMRWLRVERPAGVALHPVRTIELPLSYDDAFSRCIAGVEHTLGGIMRESDRERGRIEATFGLVNSERLTVTLERIDEFATRATIESRRNLSAEQANTSPYVDALAEALLSATRGRSNE